MVLLTVVGIIKTKDKEEDTGGVIAASESSANKSEQTRAGILHDMSGFHLPLPVSVTGRGKPLEGSGSTGTEEQTNLLRKEGRLQRLHSHKERISC